MLWVWNRKERKKYSRDSQEAVGSLKNVKYYTKLALKQKFKEEGMKEESGGELDFGEFFRCYRLNLIHRLFKGESEEEILALFSVYEFLHNLDWFVDEYNIYMRGEGKGESVAARWYEDNIALMEKRAYARPEAVNYLLKRKWFMTEKRREKFFKEAADYAVKMLGGPPDVLSRIKKMIGEIKKREKKDEI